MHTVRRAAYSGPRPEAAPAALRGVLPALISHLPADRQRFGLSVGHMAWKLRLTVRAYRALEAGEIELHDYELYLRIVDAWGWPR